MNVHPNTRRLDQLTRRNPWQLAAALACSVAAWAAFAFPARAQSCHANQVSEQFLPDGDPTEAGWTYRFDPRTQKWVRMRRAFTKSFNLNATGAGTQSVSIEMFTRSGESLEQMNLDVRASASFEIVKLALHLSLSSLERSSHSQFGIRARFKHCRPPARIEPYDLSTSDWDPAALTILTQPELIPGSRTLLWRAQGFGDYIATGTDVDGSVSAEVGLANADRYRSHQAFAQVIADVLALPATFDGQFSRLVEYGQTRGDLSIKLTAEGVDLPSAPAAGAPAYMQLLPAPSVLQSDSQRASWLSNVIAPLAAQSKVARGLYLRPAKFFAPWGTAGGPAIAPYPWDSLLFETRFAEARGAAMNTIAALRKGERWKSTPSVRTFLDQFRLPGSRAMFGAQLSYLRALEAAEVDTVVALEGMSDAMANCANPANLGSPALLAVLDTRRADLAQRVSRLLDVHLLLENLKHDPNLPPIAIQAASYSCQSGQPRTAAVKVTNAAFFADRTLDELVTLGGVGGDPSVGIWAPGKLEIFCNGDNTGSQSYPTLPCAKSQTRMVGQPVIQDVVGAAGLVSFGLRTVTNAVPDAGNFRVRVTDDLGRTGEVTIPVVNPIF